MVYVLLDIFGVRQFRDREKYISFIKMPSSQK